MCLVPGLGACSPLSRKRRVGLCRTEAGRSWFYSLGPPLRDLGVWMGAVNRRKGVLLHTVPENGHPAHGLPGLPTRGSELASKLPKKQASFQPPPTKNPDQAAHCCRKLLSRCPPPGQVKGETQFPSCAICPLGSLQTLKRHPGKPHTKLSRASKDQSAPP